MNHHVRGNACRSALLTSPLLAKIFRSRTLTFRGALLIYTLLFLALIHPFWMSGELVVPYRLTSEIGAPRASATNYIENTKFSDYWRAFIPAIRDHLQTPRSGWLALWTNDNQLGRPLFQSAGFSPTYPPTWLISKITNDPFRLLTLEALGTCFLAGVFLLLLCSELSLKPIAGLMAGGSVAASPLTMYWLTFPIFASVFCWAAGILYSLVRLARNENIDYPAASVLAFSCYSLLMTGYLQTVVVEAYILVGLLTWLTYRRWKSRGWVSSVRYLAATGTAGVTGILLTLPVFLDLVRTAAQSTRLAPDLSFFLSTLPTIDSITAAMGFLALGTFPEITENPISPSYPFPYDGLSITALILFLASVSFFLCLRKTWGWWLAIVVILAFALIHPLYAFGVQYMGLNLSRSTPLGNLILPLAVITAYGVNALAKESPFRATAARLAIFVTLACFAVAIFFFAAKGASIRWHYVLATLAVICLLVRQLNTLRVASLIAALIATGVYISFPLMLRQPSSSVVATSPLVDGIAAATARGSRFAIAAPGLPVLPPNLNAIFHVASVHSYDGLASRRYQTLIRELGGEAHTYGRLNETISPNYDSLAFWMTNIGLMMSPAPLNHPNLESIGNEGPVHLYRVISRMGCCAQMALPDQAKSDGVELHDRTQILPDLPTKILDEGDLLEFKVQGEQNSVLVLSQQYHPDWLATVRTASGWATARTVLVNGIFQGVVVPAGTSTVRLQFLPYVRFAWIAHLFWALVLLALAAQAVRSATSKTRTIDGPSDDRMLMPL